jgi:S-formylglutathione hydrolase FrmB
MMAAFHPDRFRYAGSLSGFLTPSSTTFNGAITAGLAQFGGVDTRNMWGLPQPGRWKWHDPDVHLQLLADNNTRLWGRFTGAIPHRPLLPNCRSDRLAWGRHRLAWGR